jgi:hypothetical protein
MAGESFVEVAPGNTPIMEMVAIQPTPEAVGYINKYVALLERKWQDGIVSGTALDLTFTSIKVLAEARKYRNGVQHYYTNKENAAKKIFAEARLKSQEVTDPKREADAKRNPEYNIALTELAEVSHVLGNLDAAIAQAEFFHYLFRDIYRTEAKVPQMADTRY